MISTSQRRGIKVQVPPLSRTAGQRAQSLYDGSFAVVGPKLWNTLPANITTITTKSTFKTALSRYLSYIPDRPPIDGFPSHNSLLEINRLQILGGPTSAAADSVVAASTAAVSPGSAANDVTDGLHP